MKRTVMVLVALFVTVYSLSVLFPIKSNEVRRTIVPPLVNNGIVNMKMAENSATSSSGIVNTKIAKNSGTNSSGIVNLKIATNSSGIVNTRIAKNSATNSSGMVNTLIAKSSTTNSSGIVNMPIAKNSATNSSGIVNMMIAEKSAANLSALVSQQRLLDCLTSGEWTKQPFSKEQEAEMVTFLTKTRGQYNLPNPLQRPDKKCGSISFGPGLQWFRAVCDPRFETPCCFNGQCQKKTVEECRCEHCYDMRSRLYAEYSTWKNYNSSCQVNDFQLAGACEALDGVTVDVIGDSHMRHMYMGLQILLTGDREHGCMTPDIPEGLKRECRGMYMFTEKVCRVKVRRDHLTCSGKVHVRLHELHATRYAKRILDVVNTLIGKPNSLLVIGLGHHDSFNPNAVIPIVAQPVLNMLEKSGQIWPKVIWVGAHSLGLLKTPTVPNHLNPNVLKLNNALRPFLANHKVPFLNTFNLTKGLMSPDGSHYARGANLLKARVLLDFIHRVGRLSL